MGVGGTTVPPSFPFPPSLVESAPLSLPVLLPDDDDDPELLELPPDDDPGLPELLSDEDPELSELPPASAAPPSTHSTAVVRSTAQPPATHTAIPRAAPASRRRLSAVILGGLIV
jgi:hypothetical protein